MNKLPFNHKTCDWSEKNFDANYRSKWVPKKIPTLIFSGEQDQIIPLNFFIASKKFQRNNIMIRHIKNAGHYPWIENPNAVVDLFHEYYEFLKLAYLKLLGPNK